MSFSFRNLFSQGDGEDSGDNTSSPENSMQNGSNGSGQQPFFNPQNGATNQGNFQAMFEQQMPLMGGNGADPRAVSPAFGHNQQQQPKSYQNYLASEILAFIPPALAAQSGIPMEQTIPLEMPVGSTEIRLSTICQACPALFATEITPLNDSIITLPPKLSRPSPDSAFSQPPAQTSPAGMDFASLRQNMSGSPFAKNPFADAENSELRPVAAQAVNPFQSIAEPPQQTPSQFGFPNPPEQQPAQNQHSAFSPFGSPPRPIPTEPSGATPTVGFSAIGPIVESGENNPFQQGAPASAEAIFPGGNPFETENNSGGFGGNGFGGSGFGAAGGYAPTSEPFNPPANENPFGGSNFGAAAPEPSTNPFESDASFSTIFSDKAREDASMPAPGGFGDIDQFRGPGQYSEDLPTFDEALPPYSANNPFAQQQAPAQSAANPFAPLTPPADDFSSFQAPQQQQFQHPQAPSEPAANPFAPLTPTAEQSPAPQEAQSHYPEKQQVPAEFGSFGAIAQMSEERTSIPAPSTDFAPPAFSPAPAPAPAPAQQPTQRSPFEAFAPAQASAPAPVPAQAPAVPPTPAPEEKRPQADDSFDDLSPFTAAVASRNSFFDELDNDKEQSDQSQQFQQQPPQPQKAPETAPLPAMTPAPADTVVKNIELRAVFGTDEDFDVENVARRTVGLPGIAACAIRTPAATTQAARAGETTMGKDQVEGLANSARQIAQLTGVGDAGAFTLHTDKGLISIFIHQDIILAARHSAGEFDPGVREKLMLISRGIAAL